MRCPACGASNPDDRQDCRRCDSALSGESGGNAGTVADHIAAMRRMLRRDNPKGPKS